MNSLLSSFLVFGLCLVVVQCTPVAEDESIDFVAVENAIMDEIIAESSANVCDQNLNFLLVPSLTTCANYTICACGHAHEQRCARGLIFDSRTQLCTAAQNGMCLTDWRSQPRCPPTQLQILPHPNDCTHYFTCLGGEPILRRCAAGLLFNRLSNKCDLASNTRCNLPPLVDEPYFEPYQLY